MHVACRQRSTCETEIVNARLIAVRAGLGQADLLDRLAAGLGCTHRGNIMAGTFTSQDVMHWLRVSGVC